VRTNVTSKGRRIIKKVSGSQYTYDHIFSQLNDYRNWLHGSGFKTPETKVRYKEGQIIFDQEQVTTTVSLRVESIIDKICKLSFSNFGLDSNPNNFLGNRQIYFVDFFPFLTKDARVLSEQFDYCVEEASQRYFTIENILTFYVVRLFKKNTFQAMKALKYTKEIILRNYQTILPREKVRLLQALKFFEMKNMSKYSQIYVDTKRIKEINPADNKELRQIIVSIT